MAKAAQNMNQNVNQGLDLKFGQMKLFAEKRETLKKFIEDLGLHLLLNRITEDQDRIAFTLTHMEEG